MALLLAIIPLVLTTDATPPPRLAGGFIQLSNAALELKAADWIDVANSMKAVGMETVIVQGVEYVGHDGVLFPLFEKDGVDPTAELLRHGMKVFVGLRVDENWDAIRKDPMALGKLLDDNLKVASKVWARYGSSPGFGGFYLPQELANHGYPDAELAPIRDYIRALGKHCRQISGDRPVAVSPYFNPDTTAFADPTRFASDLKRILDDSGVTEVMLQDGVGVREVATADIPAKVVPFYRAVAAALTTGQHLWGNVECFEHRDGKDFPVTDFARFADQRRAVGPLVERLVTWEFFHYLNPLGHTVADAAHRGAEKALYEAYQRELAGPMALFDGTTLAGWRKLDTVKAGEVKVEGESIVLATGGPMTAIVTTRADLPKIDYELSFEARRTAGSDFFAAATFPVGPDFLTLVNGGWGGSVTGLSSLNGSDASENETNTYIKYENGRWYRFRLRVTNAAIRCLVDDKEVFALRLDGQQLKTRIETRACQPLGFASWRSGSEIRAVAVRPLTPAEVEAVGQVPEPK